MKHISLLLAAALLGGGPVSAQLATPVAKTGLEDAIPVEKLVPTQRVRLNSETAGGLTADFSRRGAADETVVWSENFNSGMEGWTIVDDNEEKNVSWSLKKHPSLAVGENDPDDTQSLFVDGPYQIFKRQISSVESPEIDVPANAMLRCMLCFSLNFNNECALEISVSADGFETSERIYTTLDQQGEKPAQWREAAASLAAYAGRKVRLRFTYTYGLDDEVFKVGGYMGSFYIDAIRVSGALPVTRIDVQTGEKIEFVDMSSGNPSAWQWTFPGGVPATSTEQNPVVYYTRDGVYDVTLQVSDADGNVATVTKPGLVSVTGTAPAARILPPATFRYAPTRNYMVAPLAEVTFSDASDGFPTEWNWSFKGVDEDSEQVVTADTESVDVRYYFQHDWDASLTASNSHGSSSDEVTVSAEYSGSVNNLLPTDGLTTFDLDGGGTFPGSNTLGITAYAEKFSAPSAPSVISGATVYFTKNTTVELADQIADIGVHIYTCEDGKPGRKLDSDWWRAFELEISNDPTAVAGTAFEFTSRPVISDEFFIVVDGIPTPEAGADIAFAMAAFRSDNGTAWMLKDGQWREVSSYFPAGANHTSFAVYPYITHSVMSPIPVNSPDIIDVTGEAGTVTFDLFSIMGYETPVSDADWCRVVSQPNGMTLDTIEIGYDAIPQGVTNREGHITFTDGVTEYVATVRQSGFNGIDDIKSPQSTELRYADGTIIVETAPDRRLSVYDAAGRRIMETQTAGNSLRIDTASWASGLYIVTVGNETLKVVL